MRRKTEMDGAVHGSSNDDDRMWKLRKHRKYRCIS